MFERYKRFIRALSQSRIGLLGVILTTSSFVAFIVLELARLLGVVTNAYVGLITYLVFPAVFVFGLLLIPVGWWYLKRKTGRTGRELIERSFGADAKASFFGSRVFLTISSLTLINILFLAAASTRMLGFMDTPRFCGTACHSVMNPEWVTYQTSPHARVRCVDCHVGEGAGALIDSKLNGAWQIISLTFDLLERPIPTPVHQLRPARETCEKCHWPEKFYGSRLTRIVHYQDDSLVTPRYTTLNLKVDAGIGAGYAGIHWHVAKDNEVRYASIDDERERMLWVERLLPDGSYKRYINRAIIGTTTDKRDNIRILDCIDCHNRATHIYEDPGDGIDERLRRGEIPRTLPFAKRVSVRAAMTRYPDMKSARDGIANEVRGFYDRNYPRIAMTRSTAIDGVIEAVYAMYERNIHPQMKIEWGSYPSHLGHRGDGGCFRCHSQNLVADDGSHISNDCTLCHSILAYDCETPFEYLLVPDTARAEYEMHRHLHDEFLIYLEK